jgi:excisionase family DNA binding protein
MSSNQYAQTTPSEVKLAVSAREAASMLGISERLLWTWTRSGKVPHLRVGVRVLYSVELLRAWVKEQSSSSSRHTVQ